MKFRLTLAFTFIFAFSSQAQTEWAPIGAKWHFTWYEGSNHYEVYTLEVTGDTLIQGKTCSIIDGYSDIWNSCLNDDGTAYTYEEDGRVYYYDSGTESFHLLYDFTKQAGESWQVPVCEEAFSQDSLPLLVDSVATVNVSGLDVDVQYCNMWNQPHDIYRNIGSSKFLFYRWQTIVIPFPPVGYVNMRCYESPATGLLNFLGEPCDSIVSEVSGPVDASGAAVFPNPVQGEFHLQSEMPFGPGSMLYLYDLAGRPIKAWQLPTGQQQGMFWLGSVPGGLYIWKLVEDGRLAASGKLMVLE